jgi:hypothetical protein
MLAFCALRLAGRDIWTVETPVGAVTGPEPPRAAASIDSRAIPTGHERRRDADVAAVTDATLPGVTSATAFTFRWST